MSELITVKQAAQHYNVDPHTIYEWIKKGKLQVVRTPSGGIRIDKATLVGVSK